MFVLVLTGSCNNNCMFCYQDKNFSLDTEKAKSLIMEAKDRGESHINFFGGEPTIHPDFFELVKYVKEEGLDFSLNSNLRLLSYRKVAKNIVDFEPVSIQTSLHGHNAEIHDRLTRTDGSFEQATNGIKNLLDLGYERERILVNTVITKINMKYLEEIANLILNEIQLPATKFSFMEIERDAFKNAKELLPQYKEIYPFLEKAARHAQKSGKRIYIEKGPICFCPDLSNVDYIFEKVLLDTKRFIQTPSCSMCPSHVKCDGIHRNYAAFYPVGELKKKKISKLKVIFRG